MPRPLFRLLVAALLALAVPFQGMAAVMAGQCMAFGHHDTGASQDHAHAHDGADGHHHTVHSHDETPAAQQGGEGSAQSHCGPCTACCASASIAGPAKLPILSTASKTKYFFSQFPPLGVQPDGLDRPPLAL